MTDPISKELLKIFFEHGVPEITGSSRVFYHYTSAENVLKIIQSESLWMRHPTTMNDRNEIDYGFEILDRIIGSKEFSEKLEELAAAVDPLLGYVITTNYERTKQTRKNQIFISCFTRHNGRINEQEYGRLSMWRAYGNGFNKAAVGLDLSNFVGDDVGLLLLPAMYMKDEDVKSYILAAIENILSNYKDQLVNDRTMLISNMFVQFLIMFAISLKHPGFEEEAEWRIVHMRESIASNPFLEKSIETINGVPQVIIKIPFEKGSPIAIRNILKGILIGPTEFKHSISESLISCMSDVGIVDPHMLIKFSDIPLR